MLTSFLQTIKQAIALDHFSFPTLLHMIIRGIIIYFFGITLVRFNKKLLAIRTPFNFILFVMLGSIFATAIIEKELFLSIIGTMLLLILLNGVLTALAFYFPAVELFVKGKPTVIIKNGEIQWPAMRKNFITRRELLNELHTQLHIHDVTKVEYGILGSDGSITFTRKEN